MTNMIHNLDASTGEVIEREMTAAELADLTQYQSEAQLKKADREAEAADVKATKIAAYVKLGLTQKEIDALMPPDPEPLTP
jgi:hypothetical protein